MPELVPRIPRAEAVGPAQILGRLRVIEGQLERVQDGLRANFREYEELAEREHFLVSEHERLRRKLSQLDTE